MSATNPTMTEELARAATAFQRQLTGHEPKKVTVMLSDDTLVITLHGALTPAEQALAANPDGAAKVQEFHRQLFAAGAAPFRAEIKRITGVSVREAVVDFAARNGAVIRALPTGTVIQMFQLDGKPPAAARTAQDGPASAPTSPLTPPTKTQK